MREGGEFKITLCYPNSSGPSPQSFRERDDVFALLEVDATLGDGYVILEYLCSFYEMKCLQGCSKTL